MPCRPHPYRHHRRRIARVLRHPVAALFGHMLTNFSSSAHAAFRRLPKELVGLRFGDLHFHYPSEPGSAWALL